MAQPGQLCGELSACNFYASLERVSFGKQGLTLDFQTFGGRSLWGRGGVWGAGEQELGSHGMGEGLLQRLGGLNIICFQKILFDPGFHHQTKISTTWDTKVCPSPPHQALAGSRFSIPGFSGTLFCQIPGSRDFLGRDLP